jgi:hypothetical protein
VTICAAAICLSHREPPDGARKYRLLTVSDRMQTMGDMEYEQPTLTKLYVILLAHAVGLGAGDNSTITLLHHQAGAEVRRRYADTPPLLIPTLEVAKIYARQFCSLRLCRAEEVHLRPEGLDLTTFRQQPLDLVREASERLRTHELGVQVIIAGVDEQGPHIFAVGTRDAFGRESAYPVCRDGAGFFAVGSGDWLFNSHFMDHGFDYEWDLWSTLFLLYSAKKKAERAAGVGSANTDIMAVTEAGPRLLNEYDNRAILIALEEHYQRAEAGFRRSWNDEVGRIQTDARIQGGASLGRVPFQPPQFPFRCALPYKAQ